MKRFLIVDCYTKSKQFEFMKNHMLTASSLYKNIITRYFDNCEFKTIHPCYNDFIISNQLMNDFDKINGVIFTGSSYSVYDNHKHIQNCKNLFHTLVNYEIPMFGSCFGLQLFAQETGGKVEKSPNGREIGICRDIIVRNPCHFLYKHKLSKITNLSPETTIINEYKNQFNSICSHSDYVKTIKNGTILSYNRHSIQACEFTYRNTKMIGVQYHPEYTLEYLGKYLQIRKKSLFKNEVFTNKQLFDLYVNYLIEGKYQIKQLNEMFNISNELLNQKYNHYEIINWINHL